METKYFHQQETNCNVFALLSRQKGGNNRPKQNKRDEYFFFPKVCLLREQALRGKRKWKRKKGKNLYRFPSFRLAKLVDSR